MPLSSRQIVTVIAVAGATLFAVWLLTFVEGQRTSASVGTTLRFDTLVAAMIADGGVDDERVGISLVESEQWRRYIKLRDHATDEQLERLADHDSAVVRCYAFRALAERRHPQVFAMLVRRLADTQLVTTTSGCIVSHPMVADYLIATVSREHAYFAGGYAPRGAEAATLDSLLLFRRSPLLAARRWMLARLDPPRGWYGRIRSLVVTERVPDALPTLARYRRAEDTSFILHALRSDDPAWSNAGASAVAEFPHEAFHRELVARFEEILQTSPGILNEHICIALARYDSRETVALFRKALDANAADGGAENHRTIAVAMRRHPSPHYDAILATIALSSSLPTRSPAVSGMASSTSTGNHGSTAALDATTEIHVHRRARLRLCGPARLYLGGAPVFGSDVGRGQYA